MNKRLSRLLIATEALILVGVLIVGFLGGLGTLGSRLISMMTEKNTETVQDDSKEEEPKPYDSWATPEETEKPSEKESEPETSEAAEAESAEPSEAAQVQTETAAATETETESEERIVYEKASYSESKIQFSDKVEKAIAKLTTEQLVGQLIITTPEQLVGLSPVRLAGTATYTALGTRPVGGLVYDSQNFTDVSQMTNIIQNTQQFSRDLYGLDLFIAVVEPGGAESSPVKNILDGSPVEPAETLFAEGEDAVRKGAETRGSYLSDTGINMVLLTNAESYGNAADVSRKVVADMQGVQSEGVIDAVGVFPWYDDRESSESFDELMHDELSVYQAAIDGGAKLIIVSNAVVPEISGDKPCSMSSGTVDVLRGNMGYEGILMTASMSDDRIADKYLVADAVVQSIVSGIDLIYNPLNYESAYDKLLNAVNDGTISETRLHNAVGRILTAKLNK